MRLYVGNLFYTMTETDVGALFKPYGSVVKVNVIRDHFTRQSKCFGYVQMENKNEGRIAMEALHGKELHDRPLVVKEARSRNERCDNPW